MNAPWPDHPPVDADTAVADLEDADTRRALSALQTFEPGETVEDPTTTVLRAGTASATVHLGQRVTVIEEDGTTHSGVIDSVSTDGSFTFVQRPIPPVVAKWLEPHHAAARERTDEEDREIGSRLVHRQTPQSMEVVVPKRPRLATGGVVKTGPVIVGDGPKGSIL